MPQPVSVSFDCTQFGQAQDDVLVRLSIRQRVPFIANAKFEMNAVQAVHTKNGLATFRAYASPDLVTLGFADAYYVLECEAMKLRSVLWIPGAGSLAAMVVLQPPGGTPIPPGALGFYLKAEADAAIAEAVETALSPLLDQIEILQVALDGGAPLLQAPDGSFLVAPDGSYLIAR